MDSDTLSLPGPDADFDPVLAELRMDGEDEDDYGKSPKKDGDSDDDEGPHVVSGTKAWCPRTACHDVPLDLPTQLEEA